MSLLTGVLIMGLALNYSSHLDISESCQDKQSCLEEELQNWFLDIGDKTFTSECAEKLKPSSNEEIEGKMLFRLAKNCQAEGAIWQYKYTGAKGKGKIPNGKGKLSFSQQTSPPHGYDYGMKSGKCIVFDDLNKEELEKNKFKIKTIEG